MGKTSMCQHDSQDMHQHRPDESGREQTHIAAAPPQSKGGGGTAAGREAGAESRLLREASVIPVLDCQTFDPHRPEAQRVVRRHTATSPQIPHAGAAVLPSEHRCPSPLPFSASLDPRSPKHGTLSFNQSLDPRSPQHTTQAPHRGPVPMLSEQALRGGGGTTASILEQCCNTPMEIDEENERRGSDGVVYDFTGVGSWKDPPTCIGPGVSTPKGPTAADPCQHQQCWAALSDHCLLTNVSPG